MFLFIFSCSSVEERPAVNWKVIGSIPIWGVHSKEYMFEFLEIETISSIGRVFVLQAKSYGFKSSIV